jgi:hypothetical protein
VCECIAAGYKPVTGTWKMFQNKNITSATLSIIIALTIVTTTSFLEICNEGALVSEI